jgi:hypothetical protein
MDQSIDPIVRLALSDHVRASESCPLAQFVPGGASRWPQERRKPAVAPAGRTRRSSESIAASVMHATAVEADWNDPRVRLSLPAIPIARTSPLAHCAIYESEAT